MNAEEFRQHGKRMIDYIVDYLEKDIRGYPPLSRVEPGYLKTLLPQVLYFLLLLINSENVWYVLGGRI